MSEEAKAPAAAAEENIPDMSLLSITDGENERGIPVVKFIDDVGAFADSFTPPASAELLIGAYTELHSKFKTYEISLTQKRKCVEEYCGAIKSLLSHIDISLPLIMIMQRPT